MSTSKVLIILLIIIVLIAGWFILAKPAPAPVAPTINNSDNIITDTNNTDSDEVMMDDAMMAKAGSYEAYAPEKLALASTGKVVLFFRASWCPTCRTLDADIKAHLKDIPEGVTILDVNYDDSTALKQKYGVTYQHTLVQVNSAGEQITKWMGSPTLASLLPNIK